MIERFEKFVELIERLNIAFGGEDGKKLFEGQHFTLTELPDKVRSLPTPEKSPKRTGRINYHPKVLDSKRKIAKAGTGKQIMKQATDPNIWPFENGRSVAAKHSLSKKVQKITKSLLTGSTVSRRNLFSGVLKRLPSGMRKELDHKGKEAWITTLSSLLRNYSRAGYLVRVRNSDPKKEFFSLAGE